MNMDHTIKRSTHAADYKTNGLRIRFYTANGNQYVRARVKRSQHEITYNINTVVGSGRDKYIKKIICIVKKIAFDVEPTALIDEISSFGVEQKT